ncbi:glycosyltransferase involved in cell wall biosynthesis [Cryobacterium sp. MP_M5]|uniref:glycosyltransferase n=1 Tax=unclassified Cryobacterium TaxID=2649013 RepID=UPI0018CB6176|nr:MULTISPECIES: glycosyltransferase [unclassified Cryobacterium]MBG6058522.1 glycosyltransferase involved in cell wall biosynthesis [Cryobacterium sp. MP_M3]MEC5178274.1 glycosyltransferase involved in cell wall biosynthesis [Cryobacterium sp. MP_M5]
MTAIEFSLLLPVYAGDKAAYFTKAFTSTVTEQTRRPSDVVIVQDGPIGTELAAAVAAAADTSPVPVNHVRLPANVGLARALETGLRHCAHDVVARMDADDISLPTRFEHQLGMIENGFDLVGTGMLEFDEAGRVLGKRIPPTDPDDIATSARFHDPFNHPTVVYRRSVVAKAGGYRELPMMEDYWLFARMIQAGALVANLPDPLVMYRVDAGAYGRRGGWRLFRSELALQRSLLEDGFVTRRQFARNVLVRGGYRFVPVTLRRVAYRRFIVRNYANEPD